MVSSADALVKQIDGEFHGREQGQSGGRESHPHLSPLPLVCWSHLPGKPWRAGTAREQVKGEEIASARGIGPCNDEGVEGEAYYRSVGRSRTSFIISARLSLVTGSASTSGWRLISPAKAWGQA